MADPTSNPEIYAFQTLDGDFRPIALERGKAAGYRLWVNYRDYEKLLARISELETRLPVETTEHQTVIVGEYREDGTVDLCASKLPEGTNLYVRVRRLPPFGDSVRSPVEPTRRHPRDCSCTSCHYSQKYPQVKPHHATCGCFECSGEKASDPLIVSAEEAKRPLAFRHWSKDSMVPVEGCHCDTCVDARGSENGSEATKVTK